MDSPSLSAALEASAEVALQQEAPQTRYIGLALAISSSVLIGTSFIITKKVRLHLFPLLPTSTRADRRARRRVPFPLSSLIPWRALLQGLISAADRHDGMASSANYAYLKNGLWWMGMVTSESFALLTGVQLVGELVGVVGRPHMGDISAAAQPRVAGSCQRRD